MAEFPALPLWTDAYLADTRHLTTLEHGAYMLLLIEAWRRPTCSLPDDDVMLGRLAGLAPDAWQAVKPCIMAFWKLDRRSKTWTQKRLASEKNYVREKSKKQRDKAAKRWKTSKNGDAAALPDECRDDAPTPTPTPTPRKEKKGPTDSAISGELTMQLPAVDQVGAAFADFELMRRDVEPGARGLRLDQDRRRKLAARLAEVGEDGWKAALAAARSSRFLRGETSRTGRPVATIDWLLKPENLRKVLEGNYNDGHPAAATRQAPIRSPIDDLGFAISASGLVG